jgi:hypothetical protein
MATHVLQSMQGRETLASANFANHAQCATELEQEDVLATLLAAIAFRCLMKFLPTATPTIHNSLFNGSSALAHPQRMATRTFGRATRHPKALAHRREERAGTESLH